MNHDTLVSPWTDLNATMVKTKKAVTRRWSSVFE